VGRILLIGVAIVVALVFLPGLLHSGSSGAKDAGSKAGNSALDTAKDPAKVGKAVTDVTDPVVEVATPYWETLYRQPWFWTAAGAAGVAWLGRRMWRNMGHSAQLIAVGVAVALVFFMFMATGRS
jgi:nitrogen fixation-related uncharacterized protein